jgi:hypothetical protein
MLRLTALLAALFSLPSPAPAKAIEPPARPAVTELGLYLVDVTRIDEVTNTFEVELDVVQRWQDPRRAFTPAEGEPDFRAFAQDEVLEQIYGGWYPDVQLMNTVGSAEFGLIRLRINRDGTVSGRFRIRAVVRAPFDFRGFPFDSQKLPIRLESYTWDAEALQIEPVEEFTGFDPSFEMPEWRVSGVSANSRDALRSQDQTRFSRLTYLIEIERRSGYYIWKIFLPLLVITGISLVVFWMSDDALGRRAGVSATAMLTVIAFQFVIAGALPRFPYLTLMDKVVLVTLAVISLTMLENIVSAGPDSERRERLDRACRIFFPVGYVAALAIILVPALL